jgi:hypothetical protein
MKDELWNDNWHCTFANQARAQDVSDVLNASYLPPIPTGIDLFQEKQKYIYAILKFKLETAKGNAILCKYESMFDAPQKANAELTEHHLKFIKASLIKISSYTTSLAKIG